MSIKEQMDGVAEALQWIKDEVSTGEMEIRDDNQISVYAGWLDIAEMPPLVKQMLVHPEDEKRLRQEAEEWETEL